MPSGPGTRPTTDRVREAIFSALAAWAGTADQQAQSALAGLAFCDLYAGSGAVGLEAASRGAGPVVLVEQDRSTAQHIRRSASELGLRVDVRVGDAAELLRRSADTSFDVVFADPPYEVDTRTIESQVDDLIAHGWVNRPGLVVLERSRRSAAPAWPVAVTASWHRAYGETTVYFGEVEDSPSDE
jgi:16S rRNA (guanine966-N2)-methyltransferase